MSSLRDRLEQHARLHDEHVPHDAEQAQWAADLREAASEIGWLRVRVVELEAAHEAASGAILQAVEAERERCAKVCETINALHIAIYGNYLGNTYAAECARAIRGAVICASILNPK
jgi:hypothetical protein